MVFVPNMKLLSKAQLNLEQQPARAGLAGCGPIHPLTARGQKNGAVCFTRCKSTSNAGACLIGNMSRSVSFINQIFSEVSSHFRNRICLPKGGTDIFRLEIEHETVAFGARTADHHGSTGRALRVC